MVMTMKYYLFDLSLSVDQRINWFIGTSGGAFSYWNNQPMMMMGKKTGNATFPACWPLSVSTDTVL